MTDAYLPINLQFPNGDFLELLALAEEKAESPEHEIFLKRLRENYETQGESMLLSRAHSLRLRQLASGAIK
jgi:hypothetical protein